MAVYDIEQLLTDIKTILVDNLNVKITAINTEKNDSITLDSIESSAYFMQGMDGPQTNFDPFVYIGVTDIKGEEGLMSYTATLLDIAVAIIVADEGQDVEMWKRMFRYQRALREVFEENFDFKAGTVKLSVRSQVPIEIQLLNNSYSHKAIGVTLGADLG